MQVITKTPGKDPEIVEVESENGEIPYGFMNKAVGGYIERVMLWHDGDPMMGRSVCIWVDEEGLMKGLPINVVAIRSSGHRATLVGPLLVTACQGELTVGLTAEEVTKMVDLLRSGN
jgi:hypothetical protein